MQRTFKNPMTGDRIALAGPDEPREARRLQALGWIQVAGPAVPPRGDDFKTLPGVDDEIAVALQLAGYRTFDDLRNASAQDLERIPGIGRARRQQIQDELDKMAVRELVDEIVHHDGAVEDASEPGSGDDGHLPGPGLLLDGD